MHRKYNLLSRQISLFFIIISLLHPVISVAQSPLAKHLAAQAPVKLPVFVFDTANVKAVFVPVPYAKAELLDTACFELLRKAWVLSVALLYTDYPGHQHLQPLNGRRVDNLFSKIPALRADSQFSFTLYRQMNGNTKASADTMLHGFVIYYRPMPTKEDRDKEIIRIEQSIPPPTTGETTERKISQWDYIHYNRKSVSTGMQLHGRPIKLFTGNKTHAQNRFSSGDSLVLIDTETAYNQGIIGRKDLAFLKGKDSLYVLLSPLHTHKKDSIITVSIPESGIDKGKTITRILQNLPLRRAFIMADVTASMAGYNSELLYWMRSLADPQKIAWIGAFNDGDAKADRAKLIGQTEGIYAAPFSTATDAMQLLRMAMQRGSGGDMQENVTEALVHAEKLCSSCQETILIADGWAPVRDISLARTLTKPVRILVCGRDQGVRPEYVTIAAITGGSLHFTHGSYENVSAVFKDNLTIGNMHFGWRQGKAVVLNLSE